MLKHEESRMVLMMISWKTFRYLVGGLFAFLIFYALFILASIFLFVSQPPCQTRIDKEVFSPNFSQSKVGFSIRQLGDYCNFGDYYFRLEVVRFVDGKESDKTEIYIDSTNTYPATFRWLSSRELRVCSKVHIPENLGTVKEAVKWNEVRITKRFNISSETGVFYRDCYLK
jgi:hypothetical protein